MKLREPYKCNLCEKLRERDTNHWWLLFDRWMLPEDHPRNGDAAVLHLKGLMVVRWHEPLVDLCVVHACGMECALKLAERYMTTGSFDPPSARPIARPANEPMAQSPDEPIPSPSPASTRQEKS